MNYFSRASLFPTAFVIGSMAVSACHSGYKVTTSNTKVQKAACAEEWLAFPDQPHPMFEEIKGPVPNAPANMPLPKKYTRYSVSDDTLKALFIQLRNTTKRMGIILPVDKNCEPFELKVSGAMIPALQDKYAEIVSIQGKGVNNKTADVRLDWNGKQMRGQITYNGAIYFITGFTENNETTYLLYNRDDTGETKQSFEAKPNTTNFKKVYYDR